MLYWIMSGKHRKPNGANKEVCIVQWQHSLSLDTRENIYEIFTYNILLLHLGNFLSLPLLSMTNFCLSEPEWFTITLLLEMLSESVVSSMPDQNILCNHDLVLSIYVCCIIDKVHFLVLKWILCTYIPLLYFIFLFIHEFYVLIINNIGYILK